MATPSEAYAARLNIDYPEKLDRVSTFFRLIWAIPAIIIVSLLSAAATETVTATMVAEVSTIGFFMFLVDATGMANPWTNCEISVTAACHGISTGRNATTISAAALGSGSRW